MLQKFPHTILVDAAYIERVAFNLTVNFERMLGRRIPPADMAQWLVCIALDGGVQPASGDVQVVFIYPPSAPALKYFVPSDFARDINGKAFKDDLAEFSIAAYEVPDITTADDYLLDLTREMMASREMTHLMVIGDADNAALMHELSRIVSAAPSSEMPERTITLFTMTPGTVRGVREELLGYSLMAAMGIHADEFRG